MTLPVPIRGLAILALLVLVGWLVGCDGAAAAPGCSWLEPGRYRLTATAVSLNCPDFEAEVAYASGAARDEASCTEHGVTGESVWTLQSTAPGAARGRLETQDCIWTITYQRLP
jgi:hypothetical protein